MFANYNFDNLPLVYVTFSENIDSENDFDTFLDAWLQLYIDGNDFSFVFDTRLTRDINIKYCIKMALFIKKLKKVDYHYLQKSLILVNNSSIKNLLDFIKHHKNSLFFFIKKHQNFTAILQKTLKHSLDFINKS